MGVSESKEFSITGTATTSTTELKELIEHVGLKGEWTEKGSNVFFTLNNDQNIINYNTISKDFLAKGEEDFIAKVQSGLTSKIPENDRRLIFSSNINSHQFLSSKPDLIIDKLYLCGEDAATNKDHLTSLGISHVLAVGNQLSTPHNDIVKYMKIPVWDAPDEDLKQYFEKMIDFIEEGRQNGGVVIHCAAGISRSSTTTIAYLMKKMDLTFDQAYSYVLARHYCHPNYGFQEQLRKFELELRQEKEGKE